MLVDTVGNPAMFKNIHKNISCLTFSNEIPKVAENLHFLFFTYTFTEITNYILGRHYPFIKK